MLRNLPTNHTAYTVASLVYGGALEQIQYTPESATASVLFLDADDCLSYYNKTSNGIELPGDSLRVIWVELAKQVEPVSSMVRTYVERECSRCVRAIGIDDDMSIASIMKLAKAKGRTVEHITIKSTADGVIPCSSHAPIANTIADALTCDTGPNRGTPLLRHQRRCYVQSANRQGRKLGGL